jgi:hypothetical protein
LEEAGMSTVAISLVREHAAAVKPPRAVWVPFPFGLPFGYPGNAVEQQAVLDLAFSTLDAPRGPVLIDFVRDASTSTEAGAPLQASDVPLDPATAGLDFAAEVSQIRRYWEEHYAATGRTAVGLTQVPPVRFRGIVRFLEAFRDDQTADFADRPADLDRLLFVRLCVEDLRVMYAEARMQTHPHESSPERQRWLLGRTALGAFLRSLRDRMDASDDPQIKAGAFGIAR